MMIVYEEEMSAMIQTSFSELNYLLELSFWGAIWEPDTTPSEVDVSSNNLWMSS